MQNKLSAIIFFVSYACLLWFADGFANGVEQNFTFFWLPILGIFVPVAYQIYKLDTKNNNQKLLILVEILAIVLFFSILKIMLRNQFLPGADDAYSTLASTVYIQNHGDFLTTGHTMNRWPILQIFSLQISQFGFGLFNIALVSPVFFNILAVILLYLIASRFYDVKTGLLASLVFSSYYPVWLLNSRFRPEILAYVFFFSLILLYIMRRKNFSLVSIAFLSVLFLLIITMTHYTTNVMTVLFLAIMLLVFTFQKSLKLRQQLVSQSPITITILAVVVLFGYWMYIGEPLFARFATSLIEIVTPTFYPPLLEYVPPELPSSLLLKQKIITYTHDFYFLFFGGLMAYEIFRQRKCPNWQSDFALTCWAGLTLALFLVLSARPGIHASSRVFIFAYPFILIVSSHVVLKIKSRLHKKKLFGILYVVLIGFALLNVFQLELVPLNPTSSASYRIASGDGTQEVQAIDWTGATPGPIATSRPLAQKTEYMKGGEVEVSENISLFDGGMSQLKAYSWLYLESDNPHFIHWTELIHTSQPLGEEILSNIANTAWLSKVYANGEFDIYRISP